MKETSSHVAKSFLEFVNKTGSPYHSVAAARHILENAKFKELTESSSWDVERGGNYFITRNESALCAFHVGKKAFYGKEGKEGGEKDGGFVMVATHTDSPCLRVRPNSAQTKEGFLQLGVETYGGGLWHTWFDRGLGIAGKVLIRRKEGEKKCHLESHLVRIAKPLCLLPNLAIHLRTAEENAAFKIDKEAHLQPLLCSEVQARLLGEDNGSDEQPTVTDGEKKEPRHHLPLLRLIAEHCSCAPEDIIDLDICLMDSTPSRLAGLTEEFIESPRLDNLASTWAAVKALVECCAQPLTSGEGVEDDEGEKDVWMAVAFDHEEIGSQSYAGADSAALETWTSRILKSLTCDVILPQTMSRSFLISADMAHGVHPNYSEKHQQKHKPNVQQGIVIKENANQRYATQAETSALIREIASLGGIPIQDFVVKNGCACGSTVGPIVSSRLGVRAIDVGIPQWAMHSCRESCGVEDLAHYIRFFKYCFSCFRKIDGGCTKIICRD